MRTCPCCKEALTPGILGLGGRRLAGSCDLCGDAVCQACSGSRPREAEAPRRHEGAPGREREKQGRVCRSCLWEVLTSRGDTPPFPEPPGRRERVAQARRAACAHPHVRRWMGFCPACGDEVGWEAEHGNPVCEACGAPSHPLFNHCWACGESFDEENEVCAVARGYRLEFDCDARDCVGKVAWLMSFCPWCGRAQSWRHSEDDLECLECGSSLDRAWAFCVSCGEEAPLPDDCLRCGSGLDGATSAARCEECQHIVCGDCFDIHRAPAERPGRGDAPEPSERLLCSACAERCGPAPGSTKPEDGADAAEDGADAARETPPAPSSAPPSPWEVLGVAPHTPLPEVRKAYLALVAQYHPDKVAQLGPKLQALAQEETRRIIQAWDEVRQRSR